MRVSHLTSAGLFIALACGSAGCQQAPSAAQLQTVAAPVVYGVDDRVEWYDLTDEAVRTLARDVSAVRIDWDDISVADGAVSLDPGPSFGASHQMCAGERFWNQPSYGNCSGTLIDPLLILTAGHCVNSASACADDAWVFDYLYTEDGGALPIEPDDVYRCVDIVAHGGQGPDYAVLQLDRPVVDRAPAGVRAPGLMSAGDPLLMTGFPNGLPLKVDQGGAVADPSSFGGVEMVGSVDAFAGNSGSGVFDSELLVAGVLSSGETDFDVGDGCFTVNVLDPEDAGEDIVYAHLAVTALCANGFPSTWLCGDDVVGSCGDGFCIGDETLETCPDDCDALFAVPDTWTCNPGWYGAFDGCDCECGALDSDCDRPNQEILNCAPGGVCQPDGTCDLAIPSGWACDPDWYGAADDCDCGCGAYDPDCDNPGLDVFNCAPGSACNPDGTCVEPFPAAWECRRRYYAAGDDCDCDCGAYDPDCDDPSLDILNCGAGQVCDPAGECAAPPPEPEPDPGPEPQPEPEPEPQPEVASDAGPSGDIDVDAGTVPVNATSARAADGGCAGAGGPPVGGVAFLMLLLLCGGLCRRRAI